MPIVSRSEGTARIHTLADLLADTKRNGGMSQPMPQS
jgi:hypothetical protein